jgi:hypothetical protein
MSAHRQTIVQIIFLASPIGDQGTLDLVVDEVCPVLARAIPREAGTRKCGRAHKVKHTACLRAAARSRAASANRDIMVFGAPLAAVELAEFRKKASRYTSNSL